MLVRGIFFAERMKQPSKKTLQLRKEKLTNKLIQYGLDDTIPDMELFDKPQHDYVHPQQAAERLLILLAIAYAAYNFNESDKVMDWLKREDLWKSVSDREKNFFRDPDPEEEEKQNLSWRFEGAYTLAWALAKVETPADPSTECNEDQIAEFMQYVPSVGSSSEKFLPALKFRPFVDIIGEYLFYETATKYFRRIRAEDKENTSPVHVKASFERRHVLAWLRSSGTPADWDIITTQSEK